jgi:hypothetical protein
VCVSVCRFVCLSCGGDGSIVTFRFDLSPQFLFCLEKKEDDSAIECVFPHVQKEKRMKH